ncbi:hypothetical protein J8Z69_01780 [Acinetobacter nosocomialis]|uniref:hypothetical protein n=1 Tax=Acinetobacter nosocomialis TaxID=106654 RepID=UPI001AE27F07|nr:hypothetical protein [Acinetobacter nosocomialis]MBP1493034.1 hypothetical protein [Acinetobacter nosocomialis]
MTIIARIRNKSNSIVVDRNYRNLSFNRIYQINTVNSPVKLDDETQYLFNIHAFYAQNEFAVVPSYIKANNAYKPYNAFIFTQPTNVYVFSDKDIAPRNGPKLVIRNDLGIPVFSSDMKPMRVVRHLVGTIPDMGSDSNIFDEIIESGRKFAIAPCELPSRLWKYADRSSQIGYHTLIFKTDASTGRVSIRYGAAYQENLGANAWGKNAIDATTKYSILILDVTDY